MLAHELEYNGPAPIPASIAEHPLLKDGYKGRKRDLFKLTSGILNRAINSWQTMGSELTKTEEMLISEANPGLEIQGEDTVRSFYKTMEPYEIFESGRGMFEAIAQGVKTSIERELDYIIEGWSKKEKKPKSDFPRGDYDRFLYLTTRLGLNNREFITEEIGPTFELMGRIARIIAISYLEKGGEEISSEKFGEIAHTSFPIIEKLSKVKVVNGRPQFLDKAFGGWDKFFGWEEEPNTDFFQLKIGEGVSSLTLSPLGEFVYESDGESEDGIPSLPTFMTSYGVSPAEKLWHWMIDFLKDQEYTEDLVNWETADKIREAKNATSPRASS